MKPHAREEQLVIRDLDGEAVVYDFSSNKAHCINPTALAVWRRCDGKTTPRQIARALTAELKLPIDEAVVWLALEQLDRANLLRAPLDKRGAIDLSRRRVLKKLAFTAGAAVAIPAVWSILSPTPAYAASAPCIVANTCVNASQACCGAPGAPAMSCTGPGMCNGNASQCMGTICR